MLHRQWNVHDGPMWRLPWRRSPDWIPNSETAKWWNRFWFPVDGSRQYKPCNYCNYGVGDFIEDLVEDLMKLINHHFVAKKQAEFYRYWKGNLKEGECLITCAIAQNYTYTNQDEFTFFLQASDYYIDRRHVPPRSRFGGNSDIPTPTYHPIWNMMLQQRIFSLKTLSQK